MKIFKLFVLCIPLLFSLFFAGYGILSKNPFETLPCLSASAFCLFLFDTEAIIYEVRCLDVNVEVEKVLLVLILIDRIKS